MRKTKVFDVQRRGVFPPFANRIGFGKQVTALAITVDQLKDLEFFGNVLRDHLTGISAKIGAGKFKTFEKTSPRGFNTFGILAVLRKHAVNYIGVRIADKRILVHIGFDTTIKVKILP